MGVADLEVPVEVLGLTVGLRSVGRAAADFDSALRRLWSRCLTEPGPPSGLAIEVEVDSSPGESPEGDLEFAAALEAVTRQVTVMGVEHRAGDLLMLHACALSGPGDSARAAVLVGPSGMGKSTIAQRLGPSFGYVSDETAAVTPEGWLVPYPKPLSLRIEEGPVKHQRSPDELGLLRAGPRLEVAGVLLLDRRPGVAGVRLETVDTVEAVTLLAEHTSYLGRLDAPLHRLAALCAHPAGVQRVTYGDAIELAGCVGDLVAGEAR